MATAAAAAAAPEIQETLSSTETAILMERIVSDFTMEEFNKSNGAGDLDCLQKPIEHLEEQREGESFFQSPSLAAEKTGSAVIQEEKTMVRQEDSLQTKETEDKSVDDIVISEDGEQEQCHPSIQHLEENETVEDKETTCIDDLEAEESTEAVGLPKSVSMEKGNEVIQIGGEGKEPAAALDTDGYVSGGEHAEDIQKEELSSVEVNSSVEIAEPTVPSDALDTVSIPPLPLELVESSSSVVVSEIETREALEEALESNAYLNEAKESPTIGDATDETMLDGSEACEVLESGVKEKECLEEASIIQVDENEEVHSGNQEKEIETMGVVSSEIEAPEIHMKSEDPEGKDTIVEPEKESTTIVSEKDYICDDIPNEEVNDEQGSVDTSGEVKEEVLEEVVHVKEIHEERASIPETEDLTTIVEKKDATVESEGTEKLELSSVTGLKELRLEKEELQKPNDFDVEEKKPEHEDEALASHIQECNTYETEFILNENAAQELSLTLIQDEEDVESLAVEKVHEDTESTKEPREIAIADDPSIKEGHASVQDAEQLSVEVNDTNAEVVLEEHALIEKVNQTGNGDKEIADRKAEELNSKEDFKVAKEEVEKPETVVTEINSVTMEREVKEDSEVNEEVFLQPKETEDKSIDAMVIMEDEEKEQGHPLIQQAEELTVSVEDAKPEESKDDEEIETVEDKETICKDVLEAEQSAEVVLAEYASMEKENDVNQIGDGDTEPTAALDVSGGDQGGFLEDIQKEELSSSAELQKSNGYQVEETSTAYTEQTEVNSSVEIAETSIPSDAAVVSTPLVPLQFVESSSSVVVSESETREAVEEELESNSYLIEVKKTPTIGDATDETMLDGSDACEVPESGVKAKEYLDEASYIQVEVKGKAQDGNEEAKSSETTEVVSSEIELPEIHIKSEDAEGKDKTVEPEEQPVTIDAAKDYIRDDISNEEVRTQVSVDTGGEVKEQVTEESASIPETEDLTTIVEKKDATVKSEETENLELSSAVVLKEVCLEKEELHKPIDFEVEDKKPEHEDECNTYENEFTLNENATQERQSASEQAQGGEIQYVGIVNENAEEETEDKSKLSSVVNEEETPIMVKQEDILLPKETDDKSMKADVICEVGGEEQLSLTLIQDEEHAESRAVEKVREDAEATKEPRDDPSIEEGHASVEEAEQLSVEVKDANAEVVLEDRALIEKVNQRGDGDKEIADRKAEELNSKEAFKVSKEEVEKPETVVTEIRSVTLEGEVKVESEVKGSALEKDSIVEENAEEENKNKSNLSAVNEEVLQPKETEDKSIDAIVIMEDEVKEQGHQSIQQAEGLTISVEDANPEESKDDEENETVDDKETTCKDVLEAEESTEVVLAEYASMEKDNDVNQFGDGDTEPTAALDVSGGDQGGFLEDIQKEELSSSAELQKSNGYTEQTEVNSSVEIAEPSVSTDAAEVSTPLVPLQLVESSSSVVVSESETREAVEEALESNSYLNEAKETPTIGDAADETTPACEVPESGVEAKECLEEASIIQVDENEEVHSGNQEKEIETMEVVSSEIKDTEGKDQIVEPEKEPSTIVSEKDYICDDIPNEEVNDEQGSVDTSGEVKEQVIEEVVHVKEIHEKRASIPETEDLTTIVEKKDATVESEGTEKLELSSAAGLKEVRLEKQELQKANDFEVEEKKPEHEDEALASHVQECNTYETEFILNENAAQELSLTLIQDEEDAESRAVEKVHEDTESTKEPREIAIADDPSIEEGHASVQDAEQLSVEVNDANAEVVLEEHALIEKVNQTGNGDKEIADRKAEELNSKEDFKVAKEEVEKPETVVTETSSVTMEREVKEESEVNEEVFLQPKETEDKSIDAIVIMEDEEKEQGHPLIQQAEELTVSVEDAKPEESKDDEEIEAVEDKETICKDVLEAEESAEVVLAEYASMKKENDVNQIGDEDMEPTAALDVSGGDQGGFLEDIQKEELSSSAELQKLNGYQVEETSTAYTEQTEVNSSVEIAETSVPSDAAEVSTPLVPLQFVESSSSVVVPESETREAVEEALESNSYLNEVKETPTIGDATDETMLDGSEACEVPESGVKAKEYLDEASYIQVEVKGKAQDGSEEAKSSETTEVVSSEIELPEIHIKSEDAEGKDKTVEPEEQPATIDAAKDYIRDDISNEEVRTQVSVDTGGEVKEQVTEESASIPETEDLTTIVEKKDATVESEETENLELSSAVVLKEVCLEKEELHKPIDFEVEEKKPEHEDECNTYENEFILNENATQERQSASEQVQGVEIQYVGIVNENAEEETEDKSKLSSVVNEEETPIMVKQEDILLPKETDDKSMKADAICEVGGEEQLSLTLIQDEEHAESRAVEKVREDTEATKEPREIAIADDPSIEEGHASVEEAEQLSVEVRDANAEVVLEDRALIDKVNQTGDGDKEIADRKAEELNSKEAFKVSKEEVEKPETVVTEIRSVTIEGEVMVESEVKGSALEKDSIVEENAEEGNKNKSKLSAVNEEVLQPKETEDKSIDAIVIMEDEVKEQGHPLIQQAEELTVSVEDAKPEESNDDEEIETVEDKETICKDVLEAEESTEVVLAEYASMEKENDVNQIGDGDTEPTAYVVVAERETREAVEEEVESKSYLNEAKETPTIGDAADETTPGYEVPESGVEAKECLEEASIIQVDENEEVHSGNQEKEIETMKVVSSEIEAPEIHMKSEDSEGKDTIVEPEKESATIVSEKDYICDDIPNEEVSDEQGSAESIIESTSIAESIIEKDVIVESEETEKETEENNTMEIERSKMQMQDSSSIPPQTEEVIMEENASYNKIGNEESVEVLLEQTTTEEPPLSESVQESEAVSKETLILDTQHEFEELEKQPKSTDDSVYDLISNEGVNDEQRASVETTEEIEDQVVEKQNMSDEIELGDAEEIQQTPDEHVAERSCEIEMQVIKEDISIEDVYTLGKDGERDIDESDSKLEDGAVKSVNEVNKGSDSELVPDQYIEATGESESSAVKQQETVEKTEVENELIKIESSNIEEISVADVKEETPIEEEADSEKQGERDSGSWEDTSENESSTGKLEEKVVTEVEEISCPAEKVELANEAQPDTESKETEVSSHVTFETIKEETETKESISEAEDYENGDLKIQDDAEKQHESVNEKIEPLQDGISHAEADNGYEAVESETNEVSLVIEASEQEISSVEEKGTVSGDYIETEDITECTREGDDETQEPATKSESSTAELHKEEDMSSILQDKAAEEHAKEETAEEIESPGFASSVTLETGALTSEVNHEFVDSEAKNLNLEEIKKLDVTEEKKDTVSGECKEAGDTSTCVTEGVGENEIKEAEIDSTVTIESTEITSEETEAKKEEADSEPENCGLVEAEGPVSGEYKEAEEDSSETAGEVAEASEATEGVKFTEEEEKRENEATKQFIGEDVDAAKENYETVTEVSKVLTPTVHSENIESSKEVAEEEDTSYVKSVAVDKVEAKLSDVVTENGSELHPPREEAEGEGGLQDCASKEAVISDGGTQIVFDDGKITPQVKAEAFTTGVVEKNIDTSYVVIDAEVRDSKSQIIDGKGFDETSLDAATDKAADLSLSDLLHEARDQNLEVPMPLTEEKDMVGSTSELHNEETDAHEAKTDEEAEEVMVESCKEIDVKTPKKHSNILSGVSSKVKHSISKVKKAITGKSSNSKTKVSKTNEALPDS